MARASLPVYEYQVSSIKKMFGELWHLILDTLHLILDATIKGIHLGVEI